MLTINKYEKRQRMAHKVEELELGLGRLEDALKRDQSLLEMYERPMWHQFVETVLLPEKIRLAERRMSIPIDRKDDHLKIEGQYVQAEAIAMGRDSLVHSINEGLKSIDTARAKLEKARAELNRTEI